MIWRGWVILRQELQRLPSPEDLCHQDPMFHDGRCAFGQTGAAQGHLAKQGIGIGDMFLFFGPLRRAGRRGSISSNFWFPCVEEVRTIDVGPKKAAG
jgi:hypothetical protein